MITNRLLTILAASVLALGLWAAPAQALLLGFTNITGNSATDAAIGEAQLFVNVTDPLGNENLSATQALFTFGNSGPDACSITDIYFDDGSLLGIASVINGTGVDFSQGASPGNLPGANGASPPFVTTAGFSADSNPPTQPNGVNPGEALGILFNLQGSQTLEDVFAELADGRLRIGIHVQGFDSEGSESFVNGPPENPVPEPGTLLLVGIGLLGLRARRIWAK
jgi:hypothetical protein